MKQPLSPVLYTQGYLTAYLQHFHCDLTGAKSLDLNHCYDGFFIAQRLCTRVTTTTAMCQNEIRDLWFISLFSSIIKNFEMSTKFEIQPVY